MAEKKSIVIKLKYPTGRIAEKDVFTPKTITEWNIKRIVCAVGALVAIAALVWYFAFSSSPQKNTADKTVTALPPATIASSPDVNGGIDKKDDTATAEPKKKYLGRN